MMDEKVELYGWLAARNLNIDCLGEIEDLGGCMQYNHLLDKFPKDRVCLSDEEQICFMDGYVYNKSGFMGQSDDWQQSFAGSLRSDAEAHLRKLRGAFCGYTCDVKKNRTLIYTDQVSNKALYYYVSGDSWIVSNCVDYIVRVLRANHIAYHFDQTAAKYMLSYGYMLDGSTYVKEIRRLLPGCFAVLKDGRAEIGRYYFIRNEEVQMSEKDAVEKIDAAFREAVRREFDKDREYGYQHLVDLSGGLDSRMVSWVAHDMGYTDQMNIAYSRSGYLDDKISRKIACDLGHEYLFKPLDDIRWMYDIDKIVVQNNGAALYSGITGGARLLGTLNKDRFGIEHTGMIGDAILSTFYHDRTFNYGKPQMGLHRYSERLPYVFDEEVMREYPCQEMFAIYTRGILGAQTSYMIRQHYVETASPFMDVDFLDTVFSVPFEYRNRHHLYLMWIKEKYPGAADYGWEKWGGVKPLASHIFLRKVKTTKRLLQQTMCRMLKVQNKDSMNPLDAWYCGDIELQHYYESYYENHIDHECLSDMIESDICVMFRQGNVAEKSMALTVLAAVERYFGREDDTPTK